MRRVSILAMAVLVIGCGQQQSDADGPQPPASIGAATDSAAPQELANTYWLIKTLDSLTVPARVDSGPRVPHLEITQSEGTTRYSATVGCNGIGGEATISGENLTFGPGIGTKMFCEDLNAFEVQLHSVLERTRRYAISGNTLELRDEAGTRIATLEKSTPK